MLRKVRVSLTPRGVEWYRAGMGRVQEEHEHKKGPKGRPESQPIHEWPSAPQVVTESKQEF